nr:hypothetical protein [uncultured Dyadobacter sp.]
MNTNRNTIIFVFLIGFLFFALPQTSNGKDAADDLKGRVILGESEERFGSYIGQVLPDFVKKENWSIIDSIVALHSNAPSGIRKVDESRFEAFISAAEELEGNLETIGTAEALQWREDLKRTTAAIRFMKRFDLNTLADDQIDNVPLKAPREEVTL